MIFIIFVCFYSWTSTKWKNQFLSVFFLRRASSYLSRWACFLDSSMKYLMASLRRTYLELKISLKYFSSYSRRFSMFSGLSLVIPKIFFLGKGGLRKHSGTDS